MRFAALWEAGLKSTLTGNSKTSQDTDVRGGRSILAEPKSRLCDISPWDRPSTLCSSPFHPVGKPAKKRKPRRWGWAGVWGRSQFLPTH